MDLSEREQRGIEIAAKYKLTRKGKTWLVPSQSGKGKYIVDPNPKYPYCTCQDFETRRAKCKHIFAVEIVLRREQGDTQVVSTQAIKPKKKTTYKRKWPEYNKAQTKEKYHFQILLSDLCRAVPHLEHTKGRRPLPLSDMLFCMAYKIYSTVSTRRFMTDLEEAHAKGYVSNLPHYNSILNYLEMAELTLVLRQLIADSSLPLKNFETKFAVDSTGISMSRYVSWHNARYGHEQDNHDWVKLHLTCGVRTKIVTSCEITGRHAHDSPLFPRLVTSTARNFKIDEVSADKAYSSKDNLKLVARHGGVAYIPFKTSATGAGGGIWEKMHHFFLYKNEKFMEYYHKRSNVESAFNMIKSKFSGHLRSKQDTAQINEALCKVLCHNIVVVIHAMYGLGIKPELAFGMAEPPVEPDWELKEDSAQPSLFG